jgi:hypothetical protein
MDELGKSIPLSEGIVDAEQGGARKQPNEFCLNCETKLLDTFCHHCGQKDIPQRQTLGELWSNFISSFWSYEGKFFRTTKFLITKPGFLALEYNVGRRESYYHPARMYVFISFVFFLLFSITDPNNEDKKVELSEEDKKELAKEGAEELTKLHKLTGDSTFLVLNDSIQKNLADSADTTRQKVKTNRKSGAFNFNFDDVDYTSLKQYDSAQLALPEEKRDNWLEQLVNKRGIKIKEKYGDDTEKYGQDFGKAFLENFSKVLFFLLPFFALLLKLLYIRRGYFYSEHLVFSIYYYNFFYLIGSLFMLVQLVPWLDWLNIFIGFWIVLYLLFAMKRMYKQGWFKTIVKYFVLGFFFIIFLALGLFINAMAIFFSV